MESSRGTGTMNVDFSVENVSQTIEPVFDYTEESGNITFESHFTIGDPEKVSIWGKAKKTVIDIVGQYPDFQEATQEREKLDALVTCLRDKDYISGADAEELQKTNMAAWFVRSGGQFVEDHTTTGEDSIDQTTQGAINVVFSCGGYMGSGTLCNRIRLHDLDKCTEPGGPECNLASRSAQQLVNECLGQDPDDTSGFTSSRVVAHDPNIKYGPQGHVLAGQTLDYRVEYENEGEGIAYGVYFIDTLDEDLDTSSLTIGPVDIPSMVLRLLPRVFTIPGRGQSPGSRARLVLMKGVMQT